MSVQVHPLLKISGEFHIIAGRINDIAWDGDSQRIIAVGNGKERFGHCIAVDGGNSVGEISGHSSQINCVSIRQQRPLRATTGSDDASLGFYHGVPFKYNTSLRGQHNKFVYGTAFSPDGASLVSVGADRSVWLYDGETGAVRNQIGEGEHKGSIFGVSWANDSKSFVTASADQTVKIWDAEAGKVKQSWYLGEESVVSIPDQQMGVVWPHGRSDGLVISVDLEGNLNYFSQGTAKPVKVVHGHQRNVTAVGLSSAASDGSPTLWTGSSDGRVRGWNASTGMASLVDGDGHSNYIAGFASPPSSKVAGRIYSIGRDDTIRTIDTATLSFLSSGKAKTSGEPLGVAVSHAGYVLVLTPSEVEVYADGAKVSKVPLQDFTPVAFAASPAGSVTAVGGEDKSIRIYTPSTKQGEPLCTTIKDVLTTAPSTLAFSPDGAHLAIGTSGGQITVLNTSDWSVATSRWSSHTARVTSISWSKDGKCAVSGSLDTNVHVWSLKNPGRRVKMGNAHKEGVNGVVWVEAGKVVSVGADAAVKVWTVEGVE